jgi:hypothetical protein
MSDIRLLIAAMWFIMRYRSRQDFGNQIEEAWTNSGELLDEFKRLDAAEKGEE